MPDVLFDQVKRKLRVAHDDEAIDEQVKKDIIPNAKQDLMVLLGIPDAAFDFAKPGEENLLFLNYCYYDYHDAASDFEEHYAAMIARCREKWMVMQFAESQEKAPE